MKSAKNTLIVGKKNYHQKDRDVLRLDDHNYRNLKQKNKRFWSCSKKKKICSLMTNLASTLKIAFV